MSDELTVAFEDSSHSSVVFDDSSDSSVSFEDSSFVSNVVSFVSKAVSFVSTTVSDISLVSKSVSPLSQFNFSFDFMLVKTKSSSNPSLITCCSIITISEILLSNTQTISTFPADPLGIVHSIVWSTGYVNSKLNVIASSISWSTLPTILNSPSSESVPLIDSVSK